MRRFAKMFDTRDLNSWFHTMFWAIIGTAAAPLLVGVAVLAGARPAVAAIGGQLWVIAVLSGSLAAGLATGNRRIISSDRLVEAIVARRERRR